MGRGQPRDCAMKKWRVFGRGQRWFHPGERKAGLSPACLNTECDACAHARGCKQLLLSSIFLFCCLALSLSVFLASKRERCWGRWRRWIWGLQTSLSGRARSAWHLLAKAPSLVDNCTFRDRIDKNVAGGSSCLRTHSSLCARPAALQLQQLSGRSSLQWYSTVGLHRDNDLTGSVDHAQCCTLHATAQS